MHYLAIDKMYFFGQERIKEVVFISFAFRASTYSILHSPIVTLMQYKTDCHKLFTFESPSNGPWSSKGNRQLYTVSKIERTHPVPYTVSKNECRTPIKEHYGNEVFWTWQNLV